MVLDSSVISCGIVGVLLVWDAGILHEVVCAGSYWRDLFENGHLGVYKRISESGATAKKTADLNDPELNSIGGEEVVASWHSIQGVPF